MPRVKHLTIYSGQRRWSAAGEVEAAIRGHSAEEETDIPRMECPLLDLRRCPDPGGDENLAVLLGRLQRCEGPEALREAAAPLQGWAGGAGPGRSLRAVDFGGAGSGPRGAGCSQER